MRKTRLLLATALACAIGALPCESAAAEPSPAVADGESFAYALYLEYGFVTAKGGMARLDVKKRGEEYEATMTLEAQPLVDVIYHLYVKMATRLSPDMRPLSYEKHAEEGSRVYDEVSVFDYPPGGGCRVTSKQTFSDGDVKESVTNMTDQVYDLLSLAFYARRMDVSNLKPKERLEVAVVSGVKVYEQSLEYQGVEEVEIDDGTEVKAGVFFLSSDEDGGVTARFAFSQDERRVIQRVDITHNRHGSVSVRLCPAADGKAKAGGAS